jgi:predicted TIM-barrel fold metal-dependent hydrolase
MIILLGLLAVMGDIRFIESPPAFSHRNDRSGSQDSGRRRGLRLKYGQLIPLLDDIAADLPNLTIIGAHPSFPWQDAILAIAVQKTGVFIVLSGWSPKYFSPNLIRYANSILQDRVLFGSDYPFLTPDRWRKDFKKAGFKPKVREKNPADECEETS